ncbi:hypothetical protein B0H19DRAFT_1072077 [Mycena capillaripes]|nr:hypothetical protein B0H19DRAFT_1072077 [Mycena capillaripes]
MMRSGSWTGHFAVAMAMLGVDQAVNPGQIDRAPTYGLMDTEYRRGIAFGWDLLRRHRIDMENGVSKKKKSNWDMMGVERLVPVDTANRCGIIFGRCHRYLQPPQPVTNFRSGHD